MFLKRTLNAKKESFQHGCGKGVIEVNNKRRGRKIDGCDIPLPCFQHWALLPRSGKCGKVLLGNAGKLRKDFDSNNRMKGKTRSEHQSASFATSEVEEGETGPIRRQAALHLLD